MDNDHSSVYLVFATVPWIIIWFCRNFGVELTRDLLIDDAHAEKISIQR